MERKQNFINKSILKHNNFYDYRNINYVDMKTKVEIICPIHGIFKQTPDAHARGQGCNKCGIIKSKNTAFKNSLTCRGENFIKRGKEIHNNLYSYEKVNYYIDNLPVEIYCTNCNNYFFQKPKEHMMGKGCNICNKYGFNNNVKGWFYVQCLLDDDKIKAYKFGITNKTPQQRMKRHESYSTYNHELIFTFYDDGLYVRKLETYILNNIQHKYLSKFELPDGYTETISPNSINQMEELILNYLNGES